MRRLVYTVTVGDFHKEQALVTHPLIRNYAHRNGADFVVIDEARRKYAPYHPSYEDFQIIDWLEHYDEIVHMDTDVLVTKTTPWLLDISGGMMCASDEQGLYYNHALTLGFYEDYCHQKTLPTTLGGVPIIHWRYFNFGVFGVTKKDLDFYQDFLSHDFWSGDFGIQTPINYQAVKLAHPIRDLGSEFNCLHWGMKRSSTLKTAHIVHYAGTPRNWQRVQIHMDHSTLVAMNRL
jgi:hypothetical protein